MSYFLKIVFLVAFFLISLSLVFSQSVNFKFERYSKENGLSSYGPYAVIKDSKGFIWVASQNGLNRFDGIGFKVYTHDVSNPNSISDDYVICVCEDSEGNIWAGTMSKGLNMLDRKTEKFVKYFNDPNNENSISSNNIRTIIHDDGKLWIGTQNDGLNILDMKTKKVTRVKHNSANPLSLGNDFIWTLFKDSDNNIWVGTNGSGLERLIRGSNTFEHYTHNQKDPESISHNEVRTIFEDKDGYLWVGTNGEGVCRFNKKTGKFKKINFNPNAEQVKGSIVVMGIAQDENGYIWIGEYLKGLSVYDPVTEKPLKVTSNANDNPIPVLDGVFSIYRDKTGIIWICHEGKGLYVYNREKFKFGHYKNIPSDPNSLSDNIVWTFCEDNDKNIWVGNRNGLSILNPATGQFKNLPHNPKDENTVSSNAVRIFYKDRAGYIWLGNNMGALDVVDPKTGKFKHYINHPGDTTKIFSNIVAFAEDKDELLWMGTYSDGLKVFNKERTEVTTYTHNEREPNSLSSNGIWNVNLDNYDNIWIGTYTTGVDKFDKKTGRFTNYRNNPDDTNSLSSDIVSCVFQDKDGIYWMTTFGGGLNKYDMKNNVFRHYTTKEGMPDNYLYGLIEDESGRFWISTNQGLSRFDPRTEIFSNYNTGDGLQSQEFNQNSYFKSSTGVLYFGGMSGFNYFLPSDFSSSNEMPNIVFTTFKLFNKDAELPVSVTEASEIELHYNENFFTIEYAAIEYTNPSKIEYAYMLDGIDKTWNMVKNTRTAHYTNIEPGDYVFKVRHTNTEGVWKETPTELKIKINPPFWKSTWFKSIIILFLAAVVFAVYNNRLRRTRKEKASQEEFTRKLIESHEEERKKISAELHDSLGQDLIIIKNSANLAINKLKTETDTAKLINQISEISASALNNVRAISHNLRPAELDKLGLKETIKSIIELVASSSDIKFSYSVDDINNVLSKNNEVNFCRIVQECLNNILKHSKATEASVQIMLSGNNVIAVIRDNGIGFNQESVSNEAGILNFGMKTISERVKMMDGNMKINSGIGKGTEIIITGLIIKQ